LSQNRTLNDIRALLEQVQRVLIVSHIMPDGDTLGSALGLAWALRARGIEARLSCADEVPADFAFLPGLADYAVRPLTDEQAVLVVDSSDLERIGSIYGEAAFARVPVVNIDHHVTNLSFGNINLIVPKASTAELVLDVITFLEIPLDQRIATCLLTGVVTDTRGFRTSNTTADTLRAAVRLVEAGAPLSEITDAVFSHRSLDTLRLWGPALSNVQRRGRIVWAEITQEMLREAGVDISAAGGLVNFLSSFHEAQVAIVFRELEDGRVDVSMRAIPALDVSQVALAFGGGGHPQAAGCTVVGTLPDVRERIIAALQEQWTERPSDERAPQRLDGTDVRPA
jgi:phosphoesterase RecJ-like protein